MSPGRYNAHTPPQQTRGRPVSYTHLDVYKRQVYTTNTRRANVYQSAPQDIGQFFERLRSSQAIPFSHDSYMALSKGQQDDLKDVGGFVLGELRGGRRKAGAVLSRCAAVLDADNLGPGETENAVRRVEALGCGYCIYSTAKHSQGAPRLRIVIPFSEDIPADEHEPVTRLLCQMIQPEMTWFDPTTAEPSRMMYYPAHCQDIAPVYYAGDKPCLLYTSQGGNAQEELADHIHNVPPVDHTDRNQCTEVEQDGKEHVFLLHVLHPEKRLKQGQMAGAGDGQEFRHALDNPH